jgi:hypothetical protein
MCNMLTSSYPRKDEMSSTKFKPGQTRYNIDKLLASGIQYFDDLDEDQFAALKSSMGRRGPLLDPVTVTRDGILLDGHQRLKSMKAAGRDYVEATDIRLVDVPRDDALEVSIQLNLNRRHMTLEQKAELARRLQRELSWSQGKIAEKFGVSRPAVSQWLAKTEPPDEGPDDGPLGQPEPVPANGRVRGADGKEYPATIRQPGRTPVNLWSTEGANFRALHKVKKLLEPEHPVAGLSPLQAAKLAQMCQDVIDGLEKVVNDLSEVVLPPSYIRGSDDEGEEAS